MNLHTQKRHVWSIVWCLLTSASCGWAKIPHGLQTCVVCWDLDTASKLSRTRCFHAFYLKASQQPTPILQIPESAKMFPNKELLSTLVYSLYIIKLLIFEINTQDVYHFSLQIQSEAVLHYGKCVGSGWASPAGAQPGNHGPNDPWVVWPDHGPALMGPMRDLTGLAHAQAIPTVPTVAHLSPTWD